jgi:hypothetical protein
MVAYDHAPSDDHTQKRDFDALPTQSIRKITNAQTRAPSQAYSSHYYTCHKVRVVFRGESMF